MKTRNLIIGLLIAGVVSSTPVFSYTGTLNDFPKVEHIDVTFGKASPAVVKSRTTIPKKQKFKQVSLKTRNNFIMIRNGKLDSKQGMKVFKDQFKRIIVKVSKSGTYKYSSDSSIAKNGKLAVPKNVKKKMMVGKLKLKAGDALMFRSSTLNLNLHKVK